MKREGCMARPKRHLRQTYSSQKHSEHWPNRGKHILAQYDEDSVVVYQAYNRDIGLYAAEHKRFFGAPGFRSRMTWMKPNFLWMMYRSGWGSKKYQEVTLAIWLTREGWESILQEAVHSTADPYWGSEENWRSVLSGSEVRLQWDPDHSPAGGKLDRRAIQIGIKGEVAERYARGEFILDIQNISDWVDRQSAVALCGATDSLEVAMERVYVLEDEELRRRLGVDEFHGPTDFSP